MRKIHPGTLHCDKAMGIFISEGNATSLAPSKKPLSISTPASSIPPDSFLPGFCACLGNLILKHVSEHMSYLLYLPRLIS